MNTKTFEIDFGERFILKKSFLPFISPNVPSGTYLM